MLTKKIYDLIWKKSHDVIERVVELTELYENVPKELQGVSVRVLEIHCYNGEDMKAKVLKWLERDEVI